MAIEFAGTAWLLILAGLIAWELALIGWSAVSASNAARTAARVYSKSGNAAGAEADGRQSLAGNGFKPDTSSVSVAGETANVTVNIPILIPELITSPLPIHESATLPGTG